jgi:hypothetical protein
MFMTNCSDGAMTKSNYIREKQPQEQKQLQGQKQKQPSTAQRAIKLRPAQLRMTKLFGLVSFREKASARARATARATAKSNRRSFDCAAHDKTARCSAQDDRFVGAWGENKQQQKQVQRQRQLQEQ